VCLEKQCVHPFRLILQRNTLVATHSDEDHVHNFVSGVFEMLEESYYKMSFRFQVTMMISLFGVSEHRPENVLYNFY